MGLKHFIYTGNYRGECLIGLTPGIPERIKSSIGDLYGSYKKTSTIDNLLAHDRNISIDDYCPVRRKYTKVYGGNFFARMNYVGFEYLSTGRLNNIFVHGGYTTDTVSLPFAYFDVDFFKSQLTENLMNAKDLQFPEETVPEYDYNQLIKCVSEFTKDEQNLTNLSNYLPMLIKVLDTPNAHLFFYNCQSGKTLWEYIRCFSMLLPSDYIENCTFDTHINPESFSAVQGNKPNHLLLTEKIVGIYNEDYALLKLVSGHTLQNVDISLDCRDYGELYEPLSSLLSGEFDEVVKKVHIYRSLIDSCQGTCTEKIKTAIELVKTACALNNEQLEKDYISLMNSILSNEKFPKESAIIDNLLNNSIALDINVTYNLIKDISKYQTAKKALGNSLMNLFANVDSVNTISDSLFNMEECGIQLVKLLYDFDSLKGKLNALLTKNIDSHIEKFLKGDEDAKNLHDFLLSYISDYKKTFNTLVRENYNKNKQKFIEGLLSENSEETVATLGLYSEFCPNVSVDDLFKTAADQVLSNDKIALEVLQGNETSLKILNDVFEKTGDKKKDVKIEKYLEKNLYSESFLCSADINTAVNFLENSGFSSIVNRREIIKTILKFKSFESNINCLDFIVNYFKDLDESSRTKQQNEFSKYIQDIFRCDLNRTELNYRSLKKCFDTYPTVNNDIKLKSAVKYIIENDDSSSLLAEIVDSFIQSPFDNVKVFDSFLENGEENLAKTYFDSYVLKNFTYSAALSFLSKTSGDISCIISENFNEFWNYISMGGGATAKEAISLSFDLMTRVNDQTKEDFLKALIINYGLCAFDSNSIQKISKLYETQMPLVCVLTVYMDVLKTSSLSLQSYRNMMKQVTDFDKDFAPFIEKVFQSSIARGCVTGEIAPKIKNDIESCFDTGKFYRDMLSHFSIFNIDNVSSKYAVKYLDSDCSENVKSFASKYVKDETLLSKLGVAPYKYGSPGDIAKSEITFFKVAIERHTVDANNLVKMYTQFCTHSINHSDDSLLILVLLNGNLKSLDANTISKLKEVSSSSANNIVFHTSNLNSIISSGKSFPCVDEFTDDPLKSIFAWLLAYESLTRKVDESFLKFLTESYKESYISALCEIMTDFKNRFGKLVNLPLCYDFVIKKAPALINVSDTLRPKINCVTKLKTTIFGK